MLKSWLVPFMIVAGLTLAFVYVFRDKLPAVSDWVAGGRTTGVNNQPLPDTGGDGSIE